MLITRMFPDHPEFARERKWASLYVVLTLLAATAVVLSISIRAVS